MLDNAKAHLAANVVNRVTENLGISLNYGSVATPETRGIVERFFKTIEIKGFHTLIAVGYFLNPYHHPTETYGSVCANFLLWFGRA